MPTGTARHTARCVRITAAGGPEVLALGTRQLRPPQRGELLIDVAASGLNRADVLQRQGHYPAPPEAPPDVPGLEWAGTIAELGADALGPLGRPWRLGERVMGLLGGGAMSSRLLVPADQALLVPDALELHDAAGVPEAFITAWDALNQLHLRAGELLLVHAVGSGVGTAAVQLASRRGAIVAGSSRTADKLERCRALGLRHALVVASAGRDAPASFAPALLAATGGRPADAILDFVGAAYLEENLRALALRGRILVLGLLGGATGALPFGRLLERRATLIGSMLRSRPDEEKAALAAGFSAQVLPLFASGAVRPVIDAVLPVEQVREAYERMERGESFGKLVVSWA
jgi:putative PIG3 family NAD(P)H quinone oxidoreductase